MRINVRKFTSDPIQYRASVDGIVLVLGDHRQGREQVKALAQAEYARRFKVHCNGCGFEYASHAPTTCRNCGAAHE
jgi:hypothetical protein